MHLICIHAFHSKLFLPNYFMIKKTQYNYQKNTLLLLKPV